jgi:hypothetical protein
MLFKPTDGRVLPPVNIEVLGPLFRSVLMSSSKLSFAFYDKSEGVWERFDKIVIKANNR